MEWYEAVLALFAVVGIVVVAVSVHKREQATYAAERQRERELTEFLWTPGAGMHVVVGGAGVRRIREVTGASEAKAALVAMGLEFDQMEVL